MKNVYKPMLFSTPMVRGILENRKTQTRRTKGLEEINKNPDEWIFHEWFAMDQICISNKNTGQLFYPKEYYAVGDIIWVRETWLEYKSYTNNNVEVLNHYKSEHSPLIDPFLKNLGKKWTPAIHMPKRVARIFLKVVSIRVERLKEITIWDAEAEGVEVRFLDGDEEYRDYLAAGVTEEEPWGDSYYPGNPKLSFSSLWKKINGLDSWDLNPWVWVIKFEKIDKPKIF